MGDCQQLYTSESAGEVTFHVAQDVATHIVRQTNERECLDRLRAACQCTNMVHQGRSEEHTSELQSLMRISYAVFCLKKKKTTTNNKMQRANTQQTYA